MAFLAFFVAGCDALAEALEADMTQADVEALEALTDCSVVASKVGRTESGVLDGSDCTASIANAGAPRSAAVDYYGFRLDEPAEISLIMTSGAVDSYLALIRKNGTIILGDDDSAGGVDARIRLQLQAGTYLVAATANEDVDSGPYTLRIERVVRY